MPVPAAIEPVTLVQARRGRQRRDTAELGEAGLAAQTGWVVPAGDQELGGVLDAEAERIQQAGGQFPDQRLDQVIEVGNLVIELEVAAGQGLQRDSGRGHRVAEGGWVGPPSRDGADQLHPGEVAQLVAPFLGSRDDLGAQHLQRGPAGLDRGGAGDSKHAGTRPMPGTVQTTV